MKSKISFLLLLLAFILCITACGKDEAKLPTDYPNSKWSCDETEFVFFVTTDNKAENAKITDKDGTPTNVSITFSAIEEASFSVSSVDGDTVYFSGECAYGNKSITLTITDRYDSKFNNLPVILHFIKS